MVELIGEMYYAVISEIYSAYQFLPKNNQPVLRYAEC